MRVRGARFASIRCPGPEAKTAYLLLLPLLTLVGVFVLYPVAGACWTSLFRDVSFLPTRFVGLGNYTDLLARDEFWKAVRFTGLFTIVAVALEAVLGLLFALLLHERFRGRNALRAAVLVPWVIPTIVSARIWQSIFDYTYGLLNLIMTSSGLSVERINWLGTTTSAFGALVVAEVWKTTPFMVIILLAGLQAVPGDLYQQARIDGASMMRRFWRITLPLLKPVLLIALIFRTIDSLRLFDLVYVLTGGGPGGSTKTLSLLGFEYYAADSFGRGASVSVVTFLLVFTITLGYLKLGRFAESLRR